MNSTPFSRRITLTFRLKQWFLMDPQEPQWKFWGAQAECQSVFFQPSDAQTTITNSTDITTDKGPWASISRSSGTPRLERLRTTGLEVEENRLLRRRRHSVSCNILQLHLCFEKSTFCTNRYSWSRCGYLWELPTSPLRYRRIFDFEPQAGQLWICVLVFLYPVFPLTPAFQIPGFFYSATKSMFEREYQMIQSGNRPTPIESMQTNPTILKKNMECG